MVAEKNKSEDIEYFNYPEAKGINIVCFGNNVDIDDQNRAEGLNPDLHTHGQPTLYVFQGNSVGKCNFQQMYYEKNERKNEKEPLSYNLVKTHSLNGQQFGKLCGMMAGDDAFCYISIWRFSFGTISSEVLCILDAWGC